MITCSLFPTLHLKLLSSFSYVVTMYLYIFSSDQNDSHYCGHSVPFFCIISNNNMSVYIVNFGILAVIKAYFVMDQNSIT